MKWQFSFHKVKKHSHCHMTLAMFVLLHKKQTKMLRFDMMSAKINTKAYVLHCRAQNCKKLLILYLIRKIFMTNLKYHIDEI